jgi:hypothetical protein
MEQCQAVASSRTIMASVLAGTLARAPGRVIERLPFTIRRVQTEADMRKAVRVRHAAYARHVPEFARTLLEPEAADYADDTIVLLAESKFDGSALGSTRIRTNLLGPLDLEKSVVLPEWLQGRRMVEASRLGVGDGREGRLVKMALIKACFAYCLDNDIEYSVATARSAVDRQYEQLTFVDVFPDLGPIPLSHVGNIPHRVMAFHIDTFKARWQAAAHPLLGFFFHARHPDIDIHSSVEATVPSSPNARRGGGPAPARRELVAA